MQLYRHQPLEAKEGSTNYQPRREVLDCFVFNCLTGSRYGNLAALKPNDVVQETFADEAGQARAVHILEYV